MIDCSSSTQLVIAHNLDLFFAFHFVFLLSSLLYFPLTRTDALESEGFDSVVSRAKTYVEAGADAIFLEAVKTPQTYKQFCDIFPSTPILANMTEFGKTPLMNAQELKDAGVRIIL